MTSTDIECRNYQDINSGDEDPEEVLHRTAEPRCVSRKSAEIAINQ